MREGRGRGEGGEREEPEKSMMTYAIAVLSCLPLLSFVVFELVTVCGGEKREEEGKRKEGDEGWKRERRGSKSRGKEGNSCVFPDFSRNGEELPNKFFTSTSLLLEIV
jgi:hypothetical protein